MNKFATLLISIPLVALSGAAMAGDPAAGEAKGDVCLDCHEPAADFEGMSAADIEARIKAARAGEFKHAAEIDDLAEEDIADVAAWFAAEGGK